MRNRDRLNNANADKVARAAFATLNRLQDFPQEVQVIALAAAFVTIAEHLKLPAQDAFTVTKNLMNEESNLAEFKGLQDYVKYEIKR